MHLEALGLPRRALTPLQANGIGSVDDLIALNARELRLLPGVGPGTVAAILDALAAVDMALASDPWAPYVCARHAEPAADADLAGFFLCDRCRSEYSILALHTTAPEWVSQEPILGYCAHCNEHKSNVRHTQWHLCGVCERVLRSIGRGIASAKYVHEVWRDTVHPIVGDTLRMTETDPPELRTRGRRSDSTRVPLPDFTIIGEGSDDAVGGVELKTGKSAVAGGGIGAAMSRFQLDTTDCDDIAAVTADLEIPMYLIHVQVLGRSDPPTERFHGVGLWWTDMWTMQMNFLNVAIRPRETRNAAYFHTRMFQQPEALARHFVSDGLRQDRQRLLRDGVPWLYRA